jgi:hypothetical protein
MIHHATARARNHDGVQSRGVRVSSKTARTTIIDAKKASTIQLRGTPHRSR